MCCHSVLSACSRDAQAVSNCLVREVRSSLASSCFFSEILKVLIRTTDRTCPQCQLRQSALPHPVWQNHLSPPSRDFLTQLSSILHGQQPCHRPQALGPRRCKSKGKVAWLSVVTPNPVRALLMPARIAMLRLQRRESRSRRVHALFQRQ